MQMAFIWLFYTWFPSLCWLLHFRSLEKQQMLTALKKAAKKLVDRAISLASFTST
jgi:hypothetical protein